MTNIETFAFGRSEPQAPVMLSGLDRLSERVGRRLRILLEPMIGSKPVIEICAVSTVSFGGWCSTLPEFVSLSMYRLLPFKGLSVLRMDPGMITMLVDRFYGGRGGPPSRDREEFTPTEDRLVGKLSNQIIEKLVEAWAETVSIEYGLAGRETTAAHVAVMEPEEQIIVQRFEVTVGRDHVWPIEIVIPVAAVRGVEAMMGTKVHEDPSMSDPVWQARLERQMANVRLPARTVLARPNMTLAEVMQLAPGDVIPVHIGRSLPLIIGNRVFAHGNIGEQDGRAAFMIEKLAEGTDQ